MDDLTEVNATENGHEVMAKSQSVPDWASTDLHSRDFGTLTEFELNRFRALRAEGRKFDLIVSVEVMDDSEDIQAELATASPCQQEDIYRQLNTQISVRRAEEMSKVDGIVFPVTGKVFPENGCI